MSLLDRLFPNKLEIIDLKNLANVINDSLKKYRITEHEKYKIPVDQIQKYLIEDRMLERDREFKQIDIKVKNLSLDSSIIHNGTYDIAAEVKYDSSYNKLIVEEVPERLSYTDKQIDYTKIRPELQKMCADLKTRLKKDVIYIIKGNSDKK